MIVVHRIHELESALATYRGGRKTIGFVPTMGALHPGHLSLIEKSVNENHCTVCSIFINPKQFNNASDLHNYPRTLDSDLSMLEAAGCTIAFVPGVDDIYPPGFEPKTYHFGPLETVMEGAFRPGHFNGVAIVVHRLFDLVKPSFAYFGQKDFQQCAIVNALVRQQNLPLEIIICPIIREKDGLAMSSRNQRLTPEQRAYTPIIYKALLEVNEQANQKTCNQLKDLFSKIISTEPRLTIEYFEIADCLTLQPISGEHLPNKAVACTAVFVGEIRLIDNIILFS